MDLNRKTVIVRDAIASIAKHTDEDAAVRKAMLELVRLDVADQLDAIDAEVAARIAALGAPQPA